MPRAEQGLAEVFDEEVSSRRRPKRARLMRAIQGEIAGTLESIDGVIRRGST